MRKKTKSRIILYAKNFFNGIRSRRREAGVHGSRYVKSGDRETSPDHANSIKGKYITQPFSQSVIELDEEKLLANIYSTDDVDVDIDFFVDLDSKY